MKSRKEVMNILEASDLTGSYCDAGELAGCPHHTVEHWVTKRNTGKLATLSEIAERRKRIDPFLAKIEE